MARILRCTESAHPQRIIAYCLPMFGQGYSEILHGTRKQSTGRITRDSGKRQWGAGGRPEISPHQFAQIGPHGMNASS